MTLSRLLAARLVCDALSVNLSTVTEVGTMEATQALAAWAASLDLDQMPTRVRAQCKNLLLDALACAVAGHAGEETSQVAGFARALAAGGGTSILGGGEASLTGGVLLNSYLITAVTMCDAHRPTLTHVTPEVVPVALAIAERDDLSGRALLAAFAAGFEVTTRVGIGLDFPSFRAKGFHGPGILGPFGAAAAVGRLLDFDAGTMARSFGLSGSQAAGTFAAWGTPTVKFHQCRGALSGLMAALLAAEGFIANPDFLTRSDGGLYAAYSDVGYPDRVVGDLGQRWELEQIALRPWPSAAAIQGLITALFDLQHQHDFRVADVESVHVALGQRAYDMHGGFARYTGKFEAMLSAHYAAAAVLSDRELTLRQFDPARYENPDLVRFAAEKVEVGLNATLQGPAATLEIRMKGGTTLQTRCDHTLGSPESPMSTEQVEAKFRHYATPILGEPKVALTLEMVANLEGLPSVRPLLTALRAD
jgi:2-methylcitrate dehydratase PrpD